MTISSLKVVSLCDILVFAGMICCILSFLVGPPLMGLMAVPLLQVGAFGYVMLLFMKKNCDGFFIESRRRNDF